MLIPHSNTDLVAYVPRAPRAGETLHGTDFHQGFGGKGANQAVMARKLGAATAMVGAVGDDVFGTQTMQHFKELGVDTAHMNVVKSVPSGVAPIIVEASGSNSIIIIGGANDTVTPDQVAAAAPALRGAGALWPQMEVPLPATAAALTACPRLGTGAGAGPVRVFNPAPAPETLWEAPNGGTGVSQADRTALAAVASTCDIFSPNETELENLVGLPVDATSLPSMAAAAAALFKHATPRVLLVTLGAHGVLLAVPDGSGGITTRLVPATPVAAVDTSGAGDCFMGSLATLLATPLGEAGTLGKVVFDGPQVHLEVLAAAVKGAGELASLSVQARGTQSSYPTGDAAEVQAILQRTWAAVERAGASA